MDHVASSRDSHDDGWRPPHADPTGEAAVRNIMTDSRVDDYAVVDIKGHVLFRIKPEVLAGILPHLHFTKTRRGRETIRAHKKKAPTGQGEGEVTSKEIRK
ncbi:hypothetical protein GCM10009588_32070 [Microbacterium phyllosphaerae]